MPHSTCCIVDKAHVADCANNQIAKKRLPSPTYCCPFKQQTLQFLRIHQVHFHLKKVPNCIQHHHHHHHSFIPSLKFSNSKHLDSDKRLAFLDRIRIRYPLDILSDKKLNRINSKTRYSTSLTINTRRRARRFSISVIELNSSRFPKRNAHPDTDSIRLETRSVNSFSRSSKSLDCESATFSRYDTSTELLSFSSLSSLILDDNGSANEINNSKTNIDQINNSYHLKKLTNSLLHLNLSKHFGNLKQGLKLHKKLSDDLNKSYLAFRVRNYLPLSKKRQRKQSRIKIEPRTSATTSAMLNCNSTSFGFNCKLKADGSHLNNGKFHFLFFFLFLKTQNLKIFKIIQSPTNNYNAICKVVGK